VETGVRTLSLLVGRLGINLDQNLVSHPIIQIVLF